MHFLLFLLTGYAVHSTFCFCIVLAYLYINFLLTSFFFPNADSENEILVIDTGSPPRPRNHAVLSSGEGRLCPTNPEPVATAVHVLPSAPPPLKKRKLFGQQKKNVGAVVDNVRASEAQTTTTPPSTTTTTTASRRSNTPFTSKKDGALGSGKKDGAGGSGKKETDFSQPVNQRYYCLFSYLRSC